MIAWTVYLGKKHIDTVYYMANMSASEVKRGLVNHDGYDARIQVYKAK